MNIGRPRTFEPEKVLEIALNIFWEKGFEATSISDIMLATGLHKGSLYKTFGDKKSLFMAALKSYLEQIYKIQFDIIQAEPNPAIGLRKAALSMLSFNDQEGNNGPKGCMAVNTLVETAPHDTDISNMLKMEHEKFDQLIVSTLKRLPAECNIELISEPEIMSSLLMTVMCGLSANIKNLMTLEEAKHVLDQQLDLMKLK